MSGIFLSYRFTGEDPNELELLLGNIKSSLEIAGHEVDCSFHWEDFFRRNNMSSDQIYDYCLEKQKDADIFMPFLKTYFESTGMKKESLLAKELGQRYVLLEKRGIYIPHFKHAANEVITFNNYDSLFEELKHFE